MRDDASGSLLYRASVAESRSNGLRRLVARPVPIGFLLAIAGSALFAPLLAPFDPFRILDPVLLRSHSPTWSHLLGTDPYARDILSRMLFGARTSLLLAGTAVTIAITIGATIGIVSGFTGGLIDRVCMRCVDTALAIPRVLLLLTIVGIWGAPNLASLAMLLGITGWMSIGRVVRGEVRAIATLPRIETARALGSSSTRILRHHIIPELLPLLAVLATASLGQVLLLEAGLSYLGLGVPVPQASWGSVLADVSDVVGTGRWLALGPGLILMCTAMALRALGDDVVVRQRLRYRL